MTWKKITPCKEHNCERCRRKIKTEDNFYVNGFELICINCFEKVKK